MEINKQITIQINEDELANRIENRIERLIEKKMDEIIDQYIKNYMNNFNNRQNLANIAHRICEGQFVRELIIEMGDCNSRASYHLSNGVTSAIVEIAKKPEEYGNAYNDFINAVSKIVAKSFKGNKLKQLYSQIDNLIKKEEE